MYLSQDTTRRHNRSPLLGLESPFHLRWKISDYTTEAAPIGVKGVPEDPVHPGYLSHMLWQIQHSADVFSLACQLSVVAVHWRQEEIRDPHRSVRTGVDSRIRLDCY